MDLKLPPFLEIRDIPNQGKGIYTKESVSRCQSVFGCPPYSLGVGGAALENVRGSCHYCLAMIKDLQDSIVCSKCEVAGYCSTECSKSAQQLHNMECEGLAKLELLRDKPGAPTTVEPDGHSYWPPPLVLMIARAINRRYLRGAEGRNNDHEWLKHLAHHNLPSTMTEEYIAQIQKLVRGLVPDHVKDDEIDQMFRAVHVNAADVSCPPKTSASAFYLEFSLLNHSCYPNCYFKNDSTGVSVYALQDITPGSQLSISYLNPRIRIGVREERRQELKKSFGFDCCCDVCLKEDEMNSDYWHLDQQKRSLIAPWSRVRADLVMKEGWELAHKSEGMERQLAIKELESHFEVQKSVLDKANVTLILTIWQLVRNYFLLPDNKKGIAHLRSLGVTGMSAFFGYSTANEVVDIGITLSKCFGNVGLEEEASELFVLLFSFYPSHDMMRQVGIDLPASMVRDLKRKYLLQKADTSSKQLVSFILKSCDRIN